MEPNSIVDTMHIPMKSFFGTVEQGLKAQKMMTLEEYDILQSMALTVLKTNEEELNLPTFQKDTSPFTIIHQVITAYKAIPLLEGYKKCDAYVDMDRYTMAVHNFEYTYKCLHLPNGFHNGFVPVSWIFNLRKGSKTRDLLIMALHYYQKLTGEPDTWMEEDRLNQWIDECTVGEDGEISKIEHNQYLRWHNTSNNGKSKFHELLETLEAPASLLTNSFLLALTSEKLKEAILAHTKKVKDKLLVNVMLTLADMLDLHKYEFRNLTDYCDYLDCPTEEGYPLLPTDYYRFVFDPQDVLVQQLRGDLEMYSNEIGVLLPVYYSSIIDPKPKSYYDNGFLEEFIRLTSVLQSNLKNYYESIPEYGECREWFSS